MKAAMHPRIQRALEVPGGRRLLRDALMAALGRSRKQDAESSLEPETPRVRLRFLKLRDL
jgi:hypothetical protein